MRHSSRFGSVLVVALALLLCAAVPASAAEEKKTFTGFLKKLFHIPAKTAEQSVVVTGNVVENTGEKILSETGENLAAGNVPQAAVQAAVIGPAETVGEAVAGTVQIPQTVSETSPSESSAS